MIHYTDRDGHNAIAATPTWTFRAQKPPGPHPAGAYFTTLAPTTPYLASRLRIPRRKVEYMFEFADAGDLQPLPGGRGRYIFFSESDYNVEPERQQTHGPSGL